MRPRRRARFGLLPGPHEPPDFWRGWERGLGLGALAVLGGLALAGAIAWWPDPAARVERLRRELAEAERELAKQAAEGLG